jgi:hypothetical protein
VSQIDPEQVYYLMTRGIPQEEARKMLALGFFEPVVSMVDLDEVRWGIRSLLEGKWGGPRDGAFRGAGGNHHKLVRNTLQVQVWKIEYVKCLNCYRLMRDVPSLKELRGSSRPVQARR